MRTPAISDGEVSAGTNTRRGRMLSEGGFTADTEVMTTQGPRRVSELEEGTRVFALNPTSRLVKQKPLTAVESAPCDGPLVELSMRRADFRVAGGQRIPYEPRGAAGIRFQRAADLDERRYYKFVNGWRQVPSEPLDSVDITDFVDEYEMCVSPSVHGHTFNAALPDGCTPTRRNSHVGYCFDPETFKRYQQELEALAEEVAIHSGPNSRRRPYRFDGDDFVEFLGWFVTEGSVTWPSARETAVVKLAQETDTHRASIESLFERMGLTTQVTDRAYSFGSVVFASLLESLCGTGSSDKRLPDLVWSLSERQQRLLREVLLAGDGNDRQTYYTTSDQLAGNVLCLNLVLGTKPRYTRRGKMWQLFKSDAYDGFDSRTHVREIEATDEVYRLTIEDYSVVMAGRNGKFQWVGTSVVS